MTVKDDSFVTTFGPLFNLRQRLLRALAPGQKVSDDGGQYQTCRGLVFFHDALNELCLSHWITKYPDAHIHRRSDAGEVHHLEEILHTLLVAVET